MTSTARVCFDFKPNGDVTLWNGAGGLTVSHEQLQDLAEGSRYFHDGSLRFLAPQNKDKPRRFNDEDVAYWLTEHRRLIAELKQRVQALERIAARHGPDQ